MRLKLLAILLILQLGIGLSTVSYSCAAQSEEAQLKAVFLLNFAKLTEWPADSLAGGTFTICILGKTPPSSFLNMLKGQAIHGANVTVRLIDNVRSAKDSHLLYICDSERQRLQGILKELHQSPVLTVSDMPGFSEASGMIGLIPVKNRLGFEVNISSLRKSRLSISSQLLNLAHVLYGK